MNDLRHPEMVNALTRAGFETRSAGMYGSGNVGSADIWAISPSAEGVRFASVEVKNNHSNEPDRWLWGQSWTIEQQVWGDVWNPNDHWLAVGLGATRANAKMNPRLMWLVPHYLILEKIKEHPSPKYFTYDQFKNWFGEYCLVWSDSGWDIPPLHPFKTKRSDKKWLVHYNQN